MSLVSRLLASVAVLALAGPAFGQEPARPMPLRTVTIPVIPDGTVCADEKTMLIERAAAANAAAAENVQAASRVLAERQAALGRRAESAVEIDRLRSERDQRTDEWRRAEAAFDSAVRLGERDCRRVAQATETPPQAAETPRAQDRIEPVRPPDAPSSVISIAPPEPSALNPSAPAPAAPNRTATAPDASRPAVSLALTVMAPDRCQAGQACPISVEIVNNGSQEFGSPVLAAVALGFDGGTTQEITPDTWTCGRAGENLTCASGGLAIAPTEGTRFTVEWRLPARIRRPSASVCARVVWPGRRTDAVYRAEQVAAVQYALNRAGFDTGGVSGRIGPRTLEAIGQIRRQANIPGPNQITPDLLMNLFGANGDLSGDDEAANDTACTTVAFTESGGAVAAVPPEPTPRPEAAPRAAPAPSPEPRAREGDEVTGEVEAAPAPVPAAPRVREAPVRPRQAERPPAERRVVRRPPPQIEEEDDDGVVVYRSPRRGPVEVYPDPRYVRPRGTVVYGPNGPVVVYPARPRYVQPAPWGSGPRVYYERW